jgi:sugar phosphate permease
MGRTTFFAALLTTGVQGGYYTLATWVPAYLKAQRRLTVVGTGTYLAVLISGAFVGYITGSYLTDLLGRKWAFVLFAALSAVLIFMYTHVPTGANTTVLVLGFPLGLCTSAIFRGFGWFLAELYSSAHRGTGLGSPTTSVGLLGRCFPPWSDSPPAAGTWAARW